MTPENLEQFKKDGEAIRPMIDQMFDFEKKIAGKIKKWIQRNLCNLALIYIFDLE